MALKYLKNITGSTITIQSRDFNIDTLTECVDSGSFSCFAIYEMVTEMDNGNLTAYDEDGTTLIDNSEAKEAINLFVNTCEGRNR